jgi:hypothetical protein
VWICETKEGAGLTRVCVHPDFPTGNLYGDDFYKTFCHSFTYDHGHPNLSAGGENMWSDILMAKYM